MSKALWARCVLFVLGIGFCLFSLSTWGAVPRSRDEFENVLVSGRLLVKGVLEVEPLLPPDTVATPAALPEGRLRPGSYTYQVTAFNAIGETTGIPHTVGVQAPDNAVELSWEPVEGALGYRIYRNGGRITEVGADQTTFTDTGLPADPQRTVPQTNATGGDVHIARTLTVDEDERLGGNLSVSGFTTLGPTQAWSRLSLAPRTVPGYLPALLTFDGNSVGAGNWTWGMSPVPIPSGLPRPWPPTQASPPTLVTFVELFPQPQGANVDRLSFEGPVGNVTFKLGNPVPPLGAASRGSFTITDLGLAPNGATRLALGINGTDAQLTIGAPSIPAGVNQPAVPGAPGRFTILDLGAPAAPRFAINPMGNVGLGTAAPAHRLHIQDLGPGAPADLALDSTGLPGGRTWVLTSAPTGEFMLALAGAAPGMFCGGVPRLEMSPVGAVTIGLSVAAVPGAPAGSLTIAHSLGVGTPAPAGCGDVAFAGNARVGGALNVIGGLQVGGNAGIGGNLQVVGVLQLGASSWALGNLLDGPDLALGVAEPPDLSQLTLTVMEFERATGDVRVDNNLDVEGDLRVFGYSDLGDLRGRDAELDYLQVNRDLQVEGVKYFVQPDPADPTKEIVYSSLEGPEAGTYIRGEAELHDGEAVIELPEHFSAVTAEEGLTVQLTPIGEWLQLYVVELSPQRLVVREANGKDGRFYYLIQGVRRGYEDFEPVRSRGAGG